MIDKVLPVCLGPVTQYVSDSTTTPFLNVLVSAVQS